MTALFDGNSLKVDGFSFSVPWPIRDAKEFGDQVLVLLDPDAYLIDPAYKQARREGAPAIKNLMAFTRSGKVLWEADMPQASDYYYRIISLSPLKADSFSSYECEIDFKSGKIISKKFFK